MLRLQVTEENSSIVDHGVEWLKEMIVEKMPVEFGILEAIDKSLELLIQSLRYVEAQPGGIGSGEYLALHNVTLLTFAIRHEYLDQRVYSRCEHFEHLVMDKIQALVCTGQC